MDAYALLVLKDGTLFYGHSIGATGKAVGEVVFNTSMTGYQEIITDPSYSEQIIAFTYPHIGNVGINLHDQESETIQIRGLIVRCISNITHHYLQKESLSSCLKKHHVVAITDIDTRKLTRLLREKGTQIGCIITYSNKGELQKKRNEAQVAIDQFSERPQLDLAGSVSCKIPYCWPTSKNDTTSSHVIAYDFGIKRTILTMMARQHCKITVVPAVTPAQEVLNLRPDGILLSNGPGDPTVYRYAIKAIHTFLQEEIPLFGICLGHQLLALAFGAQTIKMKFGHHGGNHPVKDLRTKKVMITAQNHGFTVDESTLPAEVEITHRSLFDNSVQGICHSQKPAFGFQGHPEASPGPHDISSLFNQFRQLIISKKQPN